MQTKECRDHNGVNGSDHDRADFGCNESPYSPSDFLYFFLRQGSARLIVRVKPVNHNGCGDILHDLCGNQGDCKQIKVPCQNQGKQLKQIFGSDDGDGDFTFYIAALMGAQQRFLVGV